MSTCKLFDDIQRTYEGPADYSESEFKYINRSARELFALARCELEKWFSEYCTENTSEVADLAARFRSEDDEHHFSALTELYLYNLLKVHGYIIKTHPKLPDKKSRPEFIIFKDGKPLFVVEAVVVFGNPTQKRVEKFESSILDAMNQVASTDFLVSVSIESVNPDKMPAIGRIKKEIRRELSKLDYEAICRQIEATGEFPSWQWEKDGWKLKFTASPVKEEARTRRNENSRIIGAIQYPIKCINLDENIKKNVLRKVKKYGDLKMPFIIAVNIISESMFCDDYTIMSSLFGKETIQITSYANGTRTTRPGRTLDGIWIHPKMGVKNTRMSGLLVLSGLRSSTISEIKPVLWHHPKAQRPFDVSWLKILHRIHNIKNDRMEEVSI